MLFPEPLLPARLVRRYKRFLCDVALDTGEVVTAHCPNPGTLMGLNEPGSAVWMLPSRNPKAKLALAWELVLSGDHLVGINTGRPNRIVEEAVRAGAIPELAGYARMRREVPYGRRSRVDLLLEDDVRAPCYVEVKNVHLRRGDAAEFPDCVTERGARHMRELADMVALGHRAVLVWLVQRDDCSRFALAADIDPDYAAAVRAARSAGVEALCYACRVTLDGIVLHRPLPVFL